MPRLKSKAPEEPKSSSVGFGGRSNNFGASRDNKRNRNGQFCKPKRQRKARTPECYVTPIHQNLAGARLIDLNHFQKQLVCRKCGSELSFRAISNETNLGLASVMTVDCTKCCTKNKVQTSKINPEGSYNINVAAILGAHDAGIGNTQMRAFLSTMNTPSMTHKSFEAIEKRIGPTSISLAESSCDEAVLQEKELTMKKKHIVVCHFCDEILDCKESAEKHIQVHLDKKSDLAFTDICGICSEMVNSVQFEDHVTLHCSIMQQPLSCVFCSREYKLLPNLVKHLVGCHLISYSETLKDEMVKGISKQDMETSKPALIGITGSSDGCWLKRGNGFTYDSHAGFVSMVGQESGKVIAYRVKQNYCRRCALLGDDCHNSNCCKNWSGSSKSMEAGAVVEMIAENPKFEKLGVAIERLVCDGDSSVGAGIREATKGECVRLADVTHTIKHLSNQLFKHKNKQLTVPVIDYLKRMAAFAIKTNKDNPSAIVEALTSIPQHAFGLHNKCNPAWCAAQEKVGTHSKHLPGPIDVEGSNSFDSNLSAVSAAFEMLSRKAIELAPNGSTQANESLNAIIVSKAPKRIDFSSSQAITYRCAAGILQKNLGVSYTVKLREINKISPGKWTLGYKMRLARERTRIGLQRKSPSFKRRRRQLNFAKKNVKIRSEAKEGPTYQSGMHLIPDTPPAETKKKLKKYLPPTMRQQVSKLSPQELSSCQFVFFDTETTGLAVGSSEIIQISAKHLDSNFNCYVLPSQHIRKEITELTGISKIRGKLYHKNEPVSSATIRTALMQFIDYLESIPSDMVILVAHNARFDMSFLLHALEVNKLTDTFKAQCAGFVDTLPLAKRLLPKSTKGPNNHKISGLIQFYFGEVEIGLHDSATDVLALEGIFQCLIDGKIEELETHSFNLVEFRSHQNNLASARGMTVLLEHGVTSKQLTKLAASVKFQDLIAFAKSDETDFRSAVLRISPSSTDLPFKEIYSFLSGR